MAASADPAPPAASLGPGGAWRAALLAEARAALAPLDTLLFGVGAQKAGTTWLHAQLARRPDVAFARKEFAYWTAVRSPYIPFDSLPLGPLVPLLGRHAEGGAFRLLERLGPRPRLFAESWRALLAPPGDHRAYARSLMVGARGARLSGDVTPAYALLPRAALSEMAALHDNARFVFIMRDPVDRLWSGVRHRMRRWARRPETRGEALRAFRLALEDPLDADRLRSDYARSLGELGAAVPPGRLLCLFYETLFTPATAARLGGFLGLPDFRPDPDEVLLRGAEDWEAPGPEDRARAARALAPAYAAVLARFGEEVPARWRRSAGA